ncbi:hypothetical protein NE237_022367 [Protea cynaroides]|uniref:Uncharacterized protein n=1 Tax=Protea cynaroides TaxID=273540 RepID=A0A9Q0HA90_9MAGN|nr:hypothetical protein NE237_022367 [Protea cynaroides]
MNDNILLQLLFPSKKSIFGHRKSIVVKVSSSFHESAEGASPIAPLELESLVGQFLSQILNSHPHLVTTAVDQKLEQLQTDCESENKKEELSTSGTDPVLYRRVDQSFQLEKTMKILPDGLNKGNDNVNRHVMAEEIRPSGVESSPDSPNAEQTHPEFSLLSSANLLQALSAHSEPSSSSPLSRACEAFCGEKRLETASSLWEQFWYGSRETAQHSLESLSSRLTTTFLLDQAVHLFLVKRQQLEGRYVNCFTELEDRKLPWKFKQRQAFGRQHQWINLS